MANNQNSKSNSSASQKMRSGNRQERSEAASELGKKGGQSRRGSSNS